MPDATRMRATAKRLIDKNGEAVTITSPGARTGWDTAAGKPTFANPGTVTLKGVVTAFESAFIDGERVRTGDRMVLVAGADLTFEPEPGHNITVDGKDYAIVATDPVRLQGQVVTNSLHARGA